MMRADTGGVTLVLFKAKSPRLKRVRARARGSPLDHQTAAVPETNLNLQAAPSSHLVRALCCLPRKKLHGSQRRAVSQVDLCQQRPWHHRRLQQGRGVGVVCVRRNGRVVHSLHDVHQLPQPPSTGCLLLVKDCAGLQRTWVPPFHSAPRLACSWTQPTARSSRSLPGAPSGSIQLMWCSVLQPETSSVCSVRAGWAGTWSSTSWALPRIVSSCRRGARCRRPKMSGEDRREGNGKIECQVLLVGYF